MLQAIGLVEFNSIAKGIEAADAMLKTGRVETIMCRTICPGKYIALVSGDVAAVQSAVNAGINKGDSSVVDDFILPNVHPMVIPAISGAPSIPAVRALGIIETFSIASIIVAADKAAKAGDVVLLEIRIGIGIGGKAFVTLTGDVAAVKSAVEAGTATAVEKGLLVEDIVIPSPHKGLIPSLL